MPFLFLAIAIAAVAAFTDFRSGKIPNWLTYSALLLGPPAHAALAWGLGGTPRVVVTAGFVSVGGALLCGLLPWILWQKGACGGGDVKLFAALGAVLEPMLGFEVQLYSYYAAACIVPLGLLYRGVFWQTLKESTVAMIRGRGGRERREVDPAEPKWVRLGPAVLLACVIATFLHWRA
jgi:prepilin peptidase CpaA